MVTTDRCDFRKFDFDANPNIDAAMIHALAKCEWIKKSLPLCLIGDSGTGESHLPIALGTEAAMAGYRVKYVLATKLGNELVEAADEKQLTKTIARYGRVDLLCIDELGYMELDRRGAELLFQVLTEREEKNSVAIASNESFSGWTKTFTDPRLCAAIVDRLPFGGNIIETGTGSYRLATTRARAAEHEAAVGWPSSAHHTSAIRAYRSSSTGPPHKSGSLPSGSMRTAATRGRTATARSSAPIPPFHGSDSAPATYGTPLWPASRQRPSTSTSRPPGRKRVTHSRKAASGSGSVHTRCRANTTPNRCSPVGGIMASPTRKRPAKPAASNFVRACSTMRGARSTPVARCPASANSKDMEPVPQPMSRTSTGSVGIKECRSRAHAARVLSAVSPWSGSSSKAAAAASQ